MNLLQNPATTMLSKLFQPDQAQQPAGVQGLNAANPMQQMMQQLFQNRQQTMNTLRAPKRLDIGGNLEDPNAPKGLDWLTAHGPQNAEHRANSSARFQQLGQEAGTQSPETVAASRLFNKQHPLEVNAGGEFATNHGTGKVHSLKPGEAPAPTTVEGQPAKQWFQQHGTSGGNSNALAHIQHLNQGQQDLYAQDKGYHAPSGAQAPVDMHSLASLFGQQAQQGAQGNVGQYGPTWSPSGGYTSAMDAMMKSKQEELNKLLAELSQRQSNPPIVHKQLSQPAE